MRFTKMHGIGNDFVMVDALQNPEIADEARRRAVELNDRKFGVGGDGVIVIQPGETAPFAMKMYNPDGSESEMCGNGIRCFAKYLWDRNLTNGEKLIPVETGAGLLKLEVFDGENGKAERVRVNMGAPILTPSEIPTTLEGVNAPLEINGQTFGVTCVSMGNPHAVIFVNDVENFPVAKIGPQVEKNAAFPKRTNTEFVEVLSESEINFRVWERGAGLTLACGTGACAAVVAGVLNNKTSRQVLVHLPGGDLEIFWSDTDNHVYMTGAATEVFEGEI